MIKKISYITILLILIIQPCFSLSANSENINSDGSELYLFSSELWSGGEIFNSDKVSVHIIGSDESGITSVNGDGKIIITALPFIQNNKVVYEYTDSSQKWIFSGDYPTSLSLAQPTGRYDANTGALIIQSVNNINCFGYWQSAPGNIAAEPGNIYRAKFRVKSDQTESNIIPTFRLRLQAENNEMTSVHAVESQKGGDESPTAEKYRDYETYLIPPVSLFSSPNNGIISAFDLINIHNDDAPLALFAIDRVAIDKANLSKITQFTNILTYTFTNDAEGWISGNAYGKPPAIFGTEPGTPGTISIGSGGQNSFGVWASPKFDVNPANIYRAVFRIGRNNIAAENVPDFRIRTLSENLQDSSYLIVHSGNTGASSPEIISNGTTEYILYFTVPVSSLDGGSENIKGERIAFDLVHIDPSDSAGAILYIDSVEISSAPIPVF